MSKRQFDEALKRRGWRWGSLGYVEIAYRNASGKCVGFVDPGNAGSRRRDQLAYLIRVAQKYGWDS